MSGVSGAPRVLVEVATERGRRRSRELPVAVLRSFDGESSRVKRERMLPEEYPLALERGGEAGRVE